MMKKQLEAFYEDRKTLLWFVIFIVLVLLYVDIWNWGSMGPFIVGLPCWVVYHMVLTVFTGVVFYLFAQSIWGET